MTQMNRTKTSSHRHYNSVLYLEGRGKHIHATGQYKRCIICDHMSKAPRAVTACSRQLPKSADQKKKVEREPREGEEEEGREERGGETVQLRAGQPNVEYLCQCTRLVSVSSFSCVSCPLRCLQHPMLTMLASLYVPPNPNLLCKLFYPSLHALLTTSIPSLLTAGFPQLLLLVTPDEILFACVGDDPFSSALLMSCLKCM